MAAHKFPAKFLTDIEETGVKGGERVIM